MPIGMNRVATERRGASNNVFLHEGEYSFFCLAHCRSARYRRFVRAALLMEYFNLGRDRLEHLMISVNRDNGTFCNNVEVIVRKNHGYFNNLVDTDINQRSHFEVHPD
jgi:hypothetical protein